MTLNIDHKKTKLCSIILMVIIIIIGFVLWIKLGFKVEAAGIPFECYYYKSDGGSSVYPVIIRNDGTSSKISSSTYNLVTYKATLPASVSACPSNIYGISGHDSISFYNTTQSGSTKYNLKYQFTSSSIEFDCTYHFTYNMEPLFSDLTLHYINGTIKTTLTRSEGLITAEEGLTLSYDTSSITKNNFLSSGYLTCPNLTLYQVNELVNQNDGAMVNKRTFSFTKPEKDIYFAGTLKNDTTMTGIKIDYENLQKGGGPTLQDVKCGPYEYTVGAATREITIEYIGEQIMPNIVDTIDGQPSGLIGCPNYNYDISLIKSSDEYSKRQCGTDLYYAIEPNGTTCEVTLSYDSTELTEGYMKAEGSSKSNPGVFIDPYSGEPIDCSDFITSGGENIIYGVFKVIMIIGPILLIIFGLLDFAKATLASDEQALKKAGVDFGKRAVAAIILFLLPLIINLILGIATEVGIFDEIPKGTDINQITIEFIKKIEDWINNYPRAMFEYKSTNMILLNI